MANAQLALGVALGVLLAAWLWRSFCLFPAEAWNEVRLAPALQVWHGSPYAGLQSGPTTTWIYGPLPLLLMSPLLLARTATAAMQIGAAFNLVLIVTPLLATAWFWPAPCGRTVRMAIAFTASALWPGAAYRYFTADTAALACGLVSLLLLVRSRNPATSFAAAAACAAALLGKQTLVGLAAAELIWLGWTGNLAAAGRYAIRIAVVTLAGYALAAWAWGFDAVAFSLFDLPARQPWTNDWIGRVRMFWPDLLLQIALPAAVLAWGRRPIIRDSQWRLLALVWLFSVPLDLAAYFKHGGGANSLHAGLLVAPAALVAAYPLVGKRWRLGALTLAAVAVGAQLTLIAPGVWTPRLDLLRQADAIARARPGQVYFPWHPLVSFYAEGRIDEVEDGLFIRARAGLPVQRNRAHLPPHLHQIAFVRGETHWSIAGQLAPAEAWIEMHGPWDLLSWTPPDSHP